MSARPERHAVAERDPGLLQKEIVRIRQTQLSAIQPCEISAFRDRDGNLAQFPSDKFTQEIAVGFEINKQFVQPRLTFEVCRLRADNACRIHPWRQSFACSLK